MLSVALLVAAGALLVVWALAHWREDARVLERSARLLVPQPPAECSRQIAQVLADWPETRSLEHGSDHELEVRTRSSIAGFGERVVVRATPARDGSFVSMSSRAAHWAVLLDYGRNRRNVDAVARAILARCGGRFVDDNAPR